MRAAGRLDEALLQFEAAASAHEGSPRAYGGIAQTLRDRGRLDDAFDVYEQATKRFPDVPFLFNDRASVLSKMGRLEEALGVTTKIAIGFRTTSLRYLVAFKC